DIQNMAGLAATLKEMVVDGEIDKSPKTVREPIAPPPPPRRPHIDNTGNVNTPPPSVQRPVNPNMSNPNMFRNN
ncbi:MAG: hypothetical protein IIT39_08620, partial [Clostridia bacterium]|nr:hypothetical protein [Clostridia bacterium]